METSCPERPKVRSDLEVTPAFMEGREAFLIRDGLGLIDRPVVVQGEALNVLRLLDGTRTVLDIQTAFVRARGGVFVLAEGLEKIIRELDAAFLLDSSRFRAAREGLIDAYSRESVRAAALAGRAYPEDPAALRDSLERILKAGQAEDPDSSPVCALAAPHIDLETGRLAYAAAYRSARKLRPGRVLLLGTGHYLQGGRFAVTEKDFSTPLGTIRSDKSLARRLREAGGGSVAESDIAHRREHSLEFQAVFLQHLFGSAFTLVPVLCGSFHDVLASCARPEDVPGVGPVLALLKEEFGSCREEDLAVAGIDLSHFGHKFGHRRSARSLEAEARRHDRLLLEAACRGDVESLWAESRRTEDAYNVCGFGALAVLLSVLNPVQGRLLDYEVWMEDETRSAVSFAAIAFSRLP